MLVGCLLHDGNLLFRKVVEFVDEGVYLVVGGPDAALEQGDLVFVGCFRQAFGGK